MKKLYMGRKIRNFVIDIQYEEALHKTEMFLKGAGFSISRRKNGLKINKIPNEIKHKPGALDLLTKRATPLDVIAGSITSKGSIQIRFDPYEEDKSLIHAECSDLGVEYVLYDIKRFLESQKQLKKPEKSKIEKKESNKEEIFKKEKLITYNSHDEESHNDSYTSEVNSIESRRRPPISVEYKNGTFSHHAENPIENTTWRIQKQKKEKKVEKDSMDIPAKKKPRIIHKCAQCSHYEKLTDRFGNCNLYHKKISGLHTPCKCVEKGVE